MKRKQWLSAILAATLVISSAVCANNVVQANSLSELEKQQKKLDQKRQGIESDINKKESELKENEKNQAEAEAELKRLDLAIGDTDQKIREKREQIEKTRAEIEKLNKEIEALKIRIAERNELLKERVRSLQKSGGSVNYLDVIFGSKSFGDLISRMSAVSTLMSADQQILTEHEADQKSLQEKQVQVEEQLANLETLLAELETEMATLKKQEDEKNRLLRTLLQEQQNLEAAKLSLSEEQEIARAQAAANKKAIELEKTRIAEAQRRAEEERRKKSTNSSSNSVSNSGGSSSAPPVSSGNFTRPAEGALTSGYGPRWGDFHHGVDIAKSGSVPVVSAGDGVVIRSYYSNSYGNTIFIAHSVNGQVFTTVYAHLSSRQVSSGQTVSKGQQIGYMGNTGRSFGQHLHFEVHKGDWNGSKSNSVNPSSYVPL
ncbi:murein hydrolase activator EnvC family protein [Mangrovibacillus cuniculi]|uniref:Peptidoglycan DD-metalloendopeptidase family protein n=1 Tax=Mangrovibacillus cuniculi TaxID=2593652 RepID=A0A7S8CCT9_9BACI|nr:peptidoglycan DD-metalloendopeptidase family protein [Mangrovibacillus cuniculi]QPC47486.1 peptidoglycan DD-metalloendopeptidase family protein [Mangrovibacillus cuniculi]